MPDDKTGKRRETTGKLSVQAESNGRTKAPPAASSGISSGCNLAAYCLRLDRSAAFIRWGRVAAAAGGSTPETVPGRDLGGLRA